MVGAKPVRSRNARVARLVRRLRLSGLPRPAQRGCAHPPWRSSPGASRPSSQRIRFWRSPRRGKTASAMRKRSLRRHEERMPSAAQRKMRRSCRRGPAPGCEARRLAIGTAAPMMMMRRRSISAEREGDWAEGGGPSSSFSSTARLGFGTYYIS